MPRCPWILTTAYAQVWKGSTEVSSQVQRLLVAVYIHSTVSCLLGIDTAATVWGAIFRLKLQHGALQLLMAQTTPWGLPSLRRQEHVWLSLALMSLL